MARRNRHRHSPEGIALGPSWIALAVCLAALAHLLLFLFLRNAELSQFGEAYYDRIVPRTFRVDRVEIPPELLDPSADPTPVDANPTPREPAEIALPTERPVAAPPPETIRAQPRPEETGAIAQALDDQPGNVQSRLDEAIRSASESLPAPPETNLTDALDPADFTSGPGGNAPTFTLPQSPATRPGAGSPSFTDLDALVAATGPVADDKPIIMDAGLLFDYDSADLRPAAARDLRKVASLIQRSPNSSVLIEGHTDSFGSDPYNDELSTLRALTVKRWLVEQAGIPSDRIATTGHGKRQLIAPATGSIADQQINRRVEITIRSPGTPTTP